MTKQRRTLTPVSANEIPTFASEQEEADFWSQHELADDLLNRMESPAEDVLPPPRQRTKAISLRLDPDTLARLKALAAARGMPYQRLLKQFLVERLYVEESRGGSDVGSDAPERESRDRGSNGQSQTGHRVASARQRRSSSRPAGDAACGVEACAFVKLADTGTVRRRGDAIRRRQRIFDFAP